MVRDYPTEIGLPYINSEESLPRIRETDGSVVFNSGVMTSIDDMRQDSIDMHEDVSLEESSSSNTTYLLQKHANKEEE